jgi:hypothetical protein
MAGERHAMCESALRCICLAVFILHQIYKNYYNYIDHATLEQPQEGRPYREWPPNTRDVPRSCCSDHEHYSLLKCSFGKLFKWLDNISQRLPFDSTGSRDMLPTQTTKNGTNTLHYTRLGICHNVRLIWDKGSSTNSGNWKTQLLASAHIHTHTHTHTNTNKHKHTNTHTHFVEDFVFYRIRYTMPVSQNKTEVQTRYNQIQ